MSAHNSLKELNQAPFETLDPGASQALVVDRWGQVIPLVTAGAETRTLAAPVIAGQQATICMKTDAGDAVVTVASAVNQTGNNTLTFADAGDEITLKSTVSGSSYVWRVVSNDGVALSTV